MKSHRDEMFIATRHFKRTQPLRGETLLGLVTINIALLKELANYFFARFYKHFATAWLERASRGKEFMIWTLD